MALLLVVSIMVVTFVALFHASPRQGFAAQSTPPSPPMWTPTPIGNPPNPPTMTPTGQPATVSPTAKSASPTATHVSGPSVVFTLDAARVAHINNPGNLEGLEAIKPRSTVWLMMYYTVKTMTRKMTRQTSYVISYRGRTIFQYKGSATVKEVGRFSRYVVYKVPFALPLGSGYMFKAGLVFGKDARGATWRFQVAKQERPARKRAGSACSRKAPCHPAKGLSLRPAPDARGG